MRRRRVLKISDSPQRARRDTQQNPKLATEVGLVGVAEVCGNRCQWLTGVARGAGCPGSLDAKEGLGPEAQPPATGPLQRARPREVQGAKASPRLASTEHEVCDHARRGPRLDAFGDECFELISVDAVVGERALEHGRPGPGQGTTCAGFHAYSDDAGPCGHRGEMCRGDRRVDGGARVTSPVGANDEVKAAVRSDERRGGIDRSEAPQSRHAGGAARSLVKVVLSHPQSRFRLSQPPCSKQGWQRPWLNLASLERARYAFKEKFPNLQVTTTYGSSAARRSTPTSTGTQQLREAVTGGALGAEEAHGGRAGSVPVNRLPSLTEPIACSAQAQNPPVVSPRAAFEG
jgi:hypothetical protein